MHSNIKDIKLLRCVFNLTGIEVLCTHSSLAILC